MRLDGPALPSSRLSLVAARRRRRARPALDRRDHARRRPGRSLPPARFTARTAGCPGYVVPVLSGTLHGALRVGGETIVRRRRSRLSRSQLGILGRRALAVGTGGARRSLDRVRTRVPAGDGRGSRRGCPVFSPSWARTARLRFRPMCRSPKKTGGAPHRRSRFRRAAEGRADAATRRRWKTVGQPHGVDARWRTASDEVPAARRRHIG